MISVAILIGVEGHRSSRPVLLGMVRHGRRGESKLGQNRRGGTKQARHVPKRSGVAWLAGSEVSGWRDWLRLVIAGTDGAVSRVLAGTGLVWHGQELQAWIGRDGLGKIRRSTARQSRLGRDRSGIDGHGGKRKRRRGVERLAGNRNGVERNGRHGLVRRCEECRGREWNGRAGAVRRGLTWRVSCGSVGQGMPLRLCEMERTELIPVRSLTFTLLFYPAATHDLLSRAVEYLPRSTA